MPGTERHVRLIEVRTCTPEAIMEGGWDRDEEAEKVYLIRFIADLPLR